jgi:hypothetical protein
MEKKINKKKMNKDSSNEKLFSDENLEDNIRPPDEVFREQLIDDNIYNPFINVNNDINDNINDYEKEINEAINLSLKEISEQDEKNKCYEEKLIIQHNIEVNKRKYLFTKLIFDLNRLSKFDGEIKEIYEIIEPIIESYCNLFINNCELDSKTYDKIFNLLDKIRTDKNAINNLRTIITEEK